MSKNTIGILFILAGATYSMFAWTPFYKVTLGFLVENKWLQPPVPGKLEKNLMGPKTTIIFYSVILIGLGVYMLLAPG